VPNDGSLMNAADRDDAEAFIASPPVGGSRDEKQSMGGVN
jgi:hypothetical protein